jgi:predicted nucleic acid-binding protein
MSVTVFVDTNVLLYARDSSEPKKQRLAEAWLSHLWRERSGRLSVQVLAEFYVNATRKLDPGMPPEEAWDDVRSLMTWRPQQTDVATLELGREIERRYRIGWWDSLIVAAAQLQGCAVLLSEDFQDGAVFGGVTVRSPFSLAMEEAAADYSVADRPRELHRGRGRPARSQPVTRRSA